MNAVLATEPNPPKGEKPVEWLLLTSLPLSKTEEILNIIKWYSCRWQVEIFFKVLKSGRKIEELQLEKPDRLKPCLALYMIIAWRILFITTISRHEPDLPCDMLFDDFEWKAVWVMFHQKPPPKVAPGLEKLVKIIASFGGYTNRKSDRPPGPQMIWLGLQRMRDFALAWKAFYNTDMTYG